MRERFGERNDVQQAFEINNAAIDGPSWPATVSAGWGRQRIASGRLDMSDGGKVVVVTGASAGVGRATVREFAQQGASVGLIARGAEGLDGARREVERAGGRAHVAQADIADPDQVEAAAQSIEQALGPIDTWINVPMSSVFGRCFEITPAEYERAAEVTYLGSVYGTLAALRRMMPRDSGSIVQVGSAMAFRGVALQAPYCAAKAAVKAFNESVRCDLIHAGSSVHVGIVHLPGMNTPQYGWVRARVSRHPRPVPPVYQPEVAARAIVHVAKHRRRELWVGIPTVVSILGSVTTPELTDRIAAYVTHNLQLTSEPINAEGRDNLYAPVAGDHGARGSFNKRALEHSIQLVAATHRWTAWGLAGGAAALALGARRWRG